MIDEGFVHIPLKMSENLTSDKQAAFAHHYGMVSVMYSISVCVIFQIKLESTKSGISSFMDSY
jgi:hypothetical protein